jgi:hypothetical protein
MNQFLILSVAALLAASASACGKKCSNEPLTTVPSPSGKNTAVVFRRICEGTGPNTQVSVLASYSKLPNIPGNALILGGDVPVTVRWTSDSALTVSGMGTAKVHKQQPSVSDVSITYTN